MKKLLIHLLLIILPSAELVAQSSSNNNSNSNFVITGFGYTGFNFTSSGHATFGETGLSPIFLWRHSKKFLVETEMEFVMSNDHTEIDFGYFDFQYTLNKWMTIRAGKFLSPFGIFAEKMHPAWINRLPTMPVGFGHDGTGPTSEIGLDIRGVFRTGKAKVNYSVYVSNGPSLENGTNDAFAAGQLTFNTNFYDNNKFKNYGFRVGLLPFGNSSLEIGLSGQTGFAGVADHQFNGVYDRLSETRVTMYAADLNYVAPLRFMKSIIDIKAQYNFVNTDKSEFPDHTDSTGVTYTYTFLNVSNSYFCQLAIRPAFLSVPVVKNLELAARYAQISQPLQSKWGADLRQISIGLNYWLTWRTVLKAAYEMQDGTGSGGGGHSHGGVSHPAGSVKSRVYYIQFATSF